MATQVRCRSVKLNGLGLVLIALAGAFCAPALQGCATVDSVRDEPITYGMPRLFTGDYKTIVQASRNAITDGGLTLEVDNAVDDHTWMIVAKESADATSWGSYVRLVVEKQSDGAYVRLYSKKALATNVTAKDDYREVFDRIAANLPRTPTAPVANAPTANAPAPSPAPAPSVPTAAPTTTATAAVNVVAPAANTSPRPVATAQ